MSSKRICAVILIVSVIFMTIGTNLGTATAETGMIPESSGQNALGEEQLEESLTQENSPQEKTMQVNLTQENLTGEDPTQENPAQENPTQEELKEISVTKISETTYSITISWISEIVAEDVRYSIYVDGEEKAANIASTEFEIASLNSNQGYSIVVKAQNAEGVILGESLPQLLYTDYSGYGYELTKDLTVADCYLCNDLNLNGYTLTVKGDLIHPNYILNISNGKLIVEGDYRQQKTDNRYEDGSITYKPSYGSILRMNSSLGYMYVGGDFIIENDNYWYEYEENEAYKNFLTAGTIEIKGDFTQINAATSTYYKAQRENCTFYATGNHKVILSGDYRQTVTFGSSYCRFATLDLLNYSQDGVAFASGYHADQTNLNGCIMSSTSGERTGWKLETDEQFEGDLYIGNGTLDLNGHSLTVNGTLYQSGGVVFVDGGKLTIYGDYKIAPVQNTAGFGSLMMNQEQDVVEVTGDFTVDSTANTKGMLSAGTMYIGGDFTQKGKMEHNFAASGTHRVVFNGTKKQTIQFETQRMESSRFSILELNNQSQEGIDFSTPVFVSSQIRRGETNITTPENLCLNGGITFEENEWEGNLTLTADVALTEDITIQGDLTINNGILDLNGRTLTVTGNVIFNEGILRINRGHLMVQGDFNVLGVCTASDGLYGSMKFFGGYSQIEMVHPEDHITIAGNMNVSNKGGFSYYVFDLEKPYDNGYNYEYTYYTQPGHLLNNGVIELKGDFTQTDENGSFLCDGNHKVIFTGDKLQTVTWKNSTSGFATAELDNHSTEGVTFVNGIQVGSLIDHGCSYSYPEQEGRIGWKLTKDEIIEGDLTLLGGTLDLNGYKLTINGNLNQWSGVIAISKGELIVNGDYNICGKEKSVGNGILKMLQPEDVVRVSGNCYINVNSSFENTITNGVWYLGGNLETAIIYDGFTIHSGSNRIILNGSKKQELRGNLNLCDLETVNASEEGIDVKGCTRILKRLITNQNVVTGLSNLRIGADYEFENGCFYGDLYLDKDYKFAADVSIHGDLYFKNTISIDLNGKKVEVAGNFTSEYGSKLKYEPRKALDWW